MIIVKNFIAEKMAKWLFSQRVSCSEALEQVDQRACACLIPGSVQCHVQLGFEQYGLGEDDVHPVTWGLEMDDLQSSFQLKPFCDPVVGIGVQK